MDWAAVREDVIAQVRTSRLRRDLRQDTTTLDGLSYEDFVQQAMMEVFSTSPPPTSGSQGPEDYKALVEQITEVAIRKIENNRKKCSDRARKFSRYLPNISPSASDDEWEPLYGEILQLFEGNEDATDIVLAVLHDLCDFSDTRHLSTITELPIADVENAKKRIRRRLEKHFGELASSWESGS